eukprot:gene9887-10897_t
METRVWIKLFLDALLPVFIASQLRHGKSNLTCLDNVYGQHVLGFKGKKNMEFMEIPCIENGVDYCKTIFDKTDRRFCEKVCCAKKKPTESVAPVKTRAVVAETSSKAKLKRQDLPTVATRKRSQILIRNLPNKRKTGKERKKPFEAKLLGNNFMWYMIVVVQFVALISCGIFMIRYKIRVKNLEKRIERPVNIQPVDNEEVKETIL